MAAGTADVIVVLDVADRCRCRRGNGGAHRGWDVNDDLAVHEAFACGHGVVRLSWSRRGGRCRAGKRVKVLQAGLVDRRGSGDGNPRLILTAVGFVLRLKQQLLYIVLMTKLKPGFVCFLITCCQMALMAWPTFLLVPPPVAPAPPLLAAWLLLVLVVPVPLLELLPLPLNDDGDDDPPPGFV